MCVCVCVCVCVHMFIYLCVTINFENTLVTCSRLGRFHNLQELHVHVHASITVIKNFKIVKPLASR